MGFPAERCGAVILAGGRSSRMGACKALLTMQGETMLARLTRQLEPFGERLLSANDPALAKGLPVRRIPDRYSGMGPAGGLHAALSAAEAEALFCVPCDMPNFEPALIPLLLGRFSADMDAIICCDGNGRLHPLCGIYSKRALPVLEQCLRKNICRIRSILPLLRWEPFYTAAFLPDSVFFNMNTPEDFLQAAKSASQSKTVG